MATRKRTGRTSKARTGRRPGQPNKPHRIRVVLHSTRIKRVNARIGARRVKNTKKLIAKTRVRAKSTRKLPKSRLIRKLHHRGSRKPVRSKRRRRRSRRRMLIFSQGKRIWVVLNRRMASKAGRYLNGVRKLLRTNDLSALAEFAGESVEDIHDHEYSLETSANRLYALNATPEPFEVYQIIT